MENITTRINNLAPQLPVQCILGSSKALSDLHQFREITHKNRTLLARIDEIYRTQGYVDCHNSAADARVTRLYAMIREQHYRDYENLEILLRLLRVVCLSELDFRGRLAFDLVFVVEIIVSEM